MIFDKSVIISLVLTQDFITCSAAAVKHNGSDSCPNPKTCCWLCEHSYLVKNNKGGTSTICVLGYGSCCERHVSTCKLFTELAKKCPDN